MKNIIPQRILVTGGSGFLGRSLIYRMLEEGREVVSLGRERGNFDSRAGFVEANLSDPSSLRAALEALRRGKSFDAVIHLAVSRHHREFPQKALDLFYVNSGAVAEILEFSRLTGVKSAVFGSTGTVYNGTIASKRPSDLGDKEASFRQPSSYFAATKLFSDVIAEFYRNIFPVSVLRFYAPYGPELSGRMLNDLISRVEDGRPLSLPAKGSGLRFSAIYVDDALDILVQALDRKWNEIVNIAAPEVWTIESAGQLIGSIIGRQPLFERSDADFAPSLVPSLDRLNKLLPAHQYTGLEAGLRRMISSRYMCLPS